MYSKSYRKDFEYIYAFFCQIMERKDLINRNKLLKRRLVEESTNDLEAFAVDNAGTSLVELLLGDPHFLEGGEGSQDGATDPDGVFPLGRSDAGDLLLHTIGDTGVHGGATGEDGVGVEILT